MHKINMPQAHKAMETGTIVRWLIQPGQAVEKGQVLLIVESQQGLIEVESAVSGTLGEILCSAGTTVKVGTPIAQIETGAAQPIQSSQSEGPPRKAPPKGTVIPVVMPKAGQTMEEGLIVRWLVQVGAKISKGDMIVEIETDKATFEVEAVDSGRLARIVHFEGDVVKALEPVAYLAENDSDVEAYLASQGTSAGDAGTQEVTEADHKESTTVAAQPMVDQAGRIKASPGARKLAGQLRVDLAGIASGSGPGGRIVSTDVTAAAKAAPQTPKPAAGAKADQPIQREISPMRKAIARNLLASKQNIPHFYMRLTFDAEPMLKFYQGQKSKHRCSLNDVIVMACARVIMEFPAFRSRFDSQQKHLLEYQRANIGIAVGVEDGLVVPVVLAAEQMTFEELAGRTGEIVNLARKGRVQGAGKGVFTITNLGMFGIDDFSAIINPPESAILAVGTLREQVVVKDNKVCPGRVMTVTLSADHRIIDGMLAAKFLARLKEVLEAPDQLA